MSFLELFCKPTLHQAVSSSLAVFHSLICSLCSSFSLISSLFELSHSLLYFTPPLCVTGQREAYVWGKEVATISLVCHQIETGHTHTHTAKLSKSSSELCVSEWMCDCVLCLSDCVLISRGEHLVLTHWCLSQGWTFSYLSAFHNVTCFRCKRCECLFLRGFIYICPHHPSCIILKYLSVCVCVNMQANTREMTL